MRSHFHRDGRVVSYLDVSGTGPATPGRTLVLLHAFPLSAEMWAPQLDAVPPGWRFVAPDLRGFGIGAGGRPARRWTTTPTTSSPCSTPALERAVIGGLSMGGYVAFALYRRRRAAVRRPRARRHARRGRHERGRCAGRRDDRRSRERGPTAVCRQDAAEAARTDDAAATAGVWRPVAHDGSGQLRRGDRRARRR